jgi:hypothetical protein
LSGAVRPPSSNRSRIRVLLLGEERRLWSKLPRRRPACCEPV